MSATQQPQAADEVLAAMGTSRAVRRFRPEPVPQDVVESLIWAATRAASPENNQPWEFVVVTDPSVRARIGAMVAAAADVHAASLPPTDDPGVRRTQEAAKHLVRHFGDVPVMVFVCHHVIAYPPGYAEAGVGHSAAFMAAANLLVAARAYGLGAAFTFSHMLAGPPLVELLGLPDDVAIAVTIPVGWPERPVGPVSRRPIEEVLHWDRYGA
ncbi:MAG: nitroreductase family protein [Acidimicrobiaceae bacterium]|nr:nitroreductase family protein [Acidimicrobiaceae bacterium]